MFNVKPQLECLYINETFAVNGEIIQDNLNYSLWYEEKITKIKSDKNGNLHI
jgi:hypothetical protein